MKLEEIGFYTLSDYRASQTSPVSPMWRCEMILTDRCNFHCPYCRGVRKELRGDMPTERALFILEQWFIQGLKNIRFSGGEPTLYPEIKRLVRFCKENKVERIAVSTNGSADFNVYDELLHNGVNDFSISLDACCSAGIDKMSGSYGYFAKITENIKKLSKQTYVTVGIVITNANFAIVSNICDFASLLGVNDIRIIPAAQENLQISRHHFNQSLLLKHPILNYRINNLDTAKPFRGLNKQDCRKCWLVQDDSVIAGNYHFPCVIYLREGGKPIGKVCQNMRRDRIKWMDNKDTHKDMICSKNCLDVCRDYNNKAQRQLVRICG